MKFTLAPPRTERIEPMRRLPPLHALRVFEAAARHLHFARAAAELHLTPTAIIVLDVEHCKAVSCQTSSAPQ
ncbi:LysR family transcriptional regulator [Pseudophaeobacter arcticus]|uniref:LysR family transcriptional regulator n=2 Tax=Pseudophaeobacter arcticus TaxID=385492 RepID=UPI003614CE2A